MMLDYLLLIGATATLVLILVALFAYLTRNKRPRLRGTPFANVREWDDYVPPNDCIDHTPSALGHCICGPTVQVIHHALQKATSK